MLLSELAAASYSTGEHFQERGLTRPTPADDTYKPACGQTVLLDLEAMVLCHLVVLKCELLNSKPLGRRWLRQPGTTTMHNSTQMSMGESMHFDAHMLSHRSMHMCIRPCCAKYFEAGTGFKSSTVHCTHKRVAELAGAIALDMQLSNGAASR